MATGIGTIPDPRTYDIATETAQAIVFPALMLEEIAAAAIAPVIRDVATKGGVSLHGAITGGELQISFETTPTGGEITTLDTLVSIHDGSDPPVPGWKRWESNAVQSTTQETFQSALTQVLPSLPLGTFRVSWTQESRIVATGPVNSRGVARFTVNGSPLGSHVIESEGWNRSGGWDFFDNAVVGNKPTVAVEYGRDPALGGNDTIEIRNVKISLEVME